MTGPIRTRSIRSRTGPKKKEEEQPILQKRIKKKFIDCYDSGDGQSGQNGSDAASYGDMLSPSEESDHKENIPQNLSKKRIQKA